MRSCFLNVDLAIESSVKLDLLTVEMGRRVIVLHCGGTPKKRKYFLNLEPSRTYKGPDAAIHALCDTIENLSPAGRRLWNSARRTFDIGYELRSFEMHSFFKLEPKTVRRVADLGATLAVSYYQSEDELKTLQHRRTFE